MTRNFYKFFGVTAIVLLTCAVAYAQRQQVSGTVKDTSGGPMPGVNIILKGTTLGVSTDADGKFEIEAAPENVLVISFIGFVSQETPVGNQTSFEFTMTEDLTTLSEVVVIGYGEQKKALNTGANLQVKGEDLQKLSTTNALQALQGQAPGVQVTSTSGQPGAAFKVIIRGSGTIGKGDPLYVVDGVLTNDITYLNSADIQSIDVLKDAASAAIYGSQAANGVVLVTTKKGKRGHAQITFDAYYGVQNVARKIRMLNAQEYATIRNEAAVNSGKLPYYTQDSIANMGAGTNWLDKMFVKDAPTRGYSFGASGGSDASTYSLGLSYVSQVGIVGGKDISNYDRYNFRFNSEHKLYKDRVLVGQNLTFANTDNNGIQVGGNYNNDLRAAFKTTPLLVDSRTDTVGMFNQANPYSAMVYNSHNARNTQRVMGNVYLQIEPIKNLTFRTSVGLDYSASDGHSYVPVYALSTYSYNRYAKVSQDMNRNKTIIIDNLLSYGFNKGEHRFDVMAGTSSYQYAGNTLGASNTGFTYNNLDNAWLTNALNKDGATITLRGGPGTPDPGTSDPKYNPNKRMSYFGRIGYNYKETYLLNATFRADGSSQFAAGNRWGYFPSVSAGWVMTNSSLLADTRNWLSFLKLRASWGQVGNQNASAYQYLALVQSATTNYTFGPTEGTGGLVPGAYNYNISNPKLKWETSEQRNIGFDASLLDGRLTAIFDWYNKTTKDWLITAPVFATAGAEPPYINGGNVVNKGIEMALAYNNSINGFNYKVGINGAYNQNKVTNVPTLDHIIHPPSSGNQLWNNAPEFYRAEQGFPVGYFWGLHTNGVFQTEADVANYTSSEGKVIQPGASPGDVRYVDTNDDGVITDADKGMIGNPNPKYTFGMTLSADYKGFDFSVLASGVAGNDLVQSYRDQSGQYDNYTSAILDRWHGPGSSNRMPRVTEDNRNFAFSDLYVHKGDFLRISNVTLGYSLNKLWQSKFISQCRVYVSALNLYTFTKYTGMDPEIGYGPDPMSQGVDVGYYPRPRTYMVGVNVKF